MCLRRVRKAVIGLAQRTHTDVIKPNSSGLDSIYWHIGLFWVGYGRKEYKKLTCAGKAESSIYSCAYKHCTQDELTAYFICENRNCGHIKKKEQPTTIY